MNVLNLLYILTKLKLRSLRNGLKILNLYHTEITMFYLLEIATKCTVDLEEFSKLVNDEISLPGIQIYLQSNNQVCKMPKHFKGK